MCKLIQAYVEFLRRPNQTRTLAEAKQKLIESQTAIRQLVRQKESDLVSKAAVEHA